MAQVNVELGYASNAQISLNDAAVRALAGIPSGAISLNDLHGKTFYYPVPAGLIIMSADGSTPSGWTRFSAADGRHIVGAGSSYSYNSTGGSATLSPSNSGYSGGQGAHGDHANEMWMYFDQNTWRADPYNSNYYGAHAHLITLNTYVPNKQNMVLIKANGNGNQLPAYGMGFGTSTLSGCSVYSSSNFLAGAASISSVADTLGATCGTSGAHRPSNSAYKTYYGTYGYSYLDGYIGDHSDHPITVTATNSFKQAVLRGLYQAGAYAPIAGLIGMWEGTTAPGKWALCDGANGTVDLRDYFILFSASGTGSKSGTNQITLTPVIGTVSWTHNHYGNWQGRGYGSDNNNYIGNVSASHSHTFTSNYTYTYTPPYYALTFIQYTG